VISVVIPTRNEAANIGRLLAALATEPGPHECIVVDAGTDTTAAIAAQAGARVVASPPGRGRQIRAGVEIATGSVIWMLHADSRPPPGCLAAIARALEPPDIVGGNFRLLFDGEDRFSRWLDGFYAWLRGNGFYYGDSGIFVRREVYDRLGGMPTHALMEDYAFVRRLEAAGPTACIAEPPLVTSSRRFHGRSAAGIVGGWLLIHGLYHLGVNPARLAWIYDRMLRPTRPR
jgi:rSAM/selenodomain-associated transferase 2